MAKLMTGIACILAALGLMSCSSSGSSVDAPPSYDTVLPTVADPAPTSTAAAGVAACVSASREVVVEVSEGLKKPATALTNTFTVSTTPAERSSVEAARVVLAGRISGSSGNVVGTWAYSGSGIDALNAAAQKYSDWGSAATAGSPIALARAKAVNWPETVKATTCAGRNRSKTSRVSANSNPCNFPSSPDVIVWIKYAGASGSAQLLGAYDFGNCTRTADTVIKTAPQQPGDCTIVASVAANPGYNTDADPAPRPKSVLAESGPAC